MAALRADFLMIRDLLREPVPVAAGPQEQLGLF
jgi:hypothetical protein